MNKARRIILKTFLMMALTTTPYLSTAHLINKKFILVYFPEGGAVTAELAVSPRERALGLMFRKSLAFDQGMLFVFERESEHSFWMKNMLIPLDLLWLDKDKRIVHMERCIPPCKKIPCPSYQTKIPALYVLELKAGSVKRRNLQMFDRLDFVLPSGFQIQ